MNIFNKKTILFFSISTLMFNGCVTKNELPVKSPTRVMISPKVLPAKVIWKKLKPPSLINKKDNKKDDCITCYATPTSYSKPPSATKTFNAIKPKRYGAYYYTETASDTTVKKNNYTSINTNRYSLPAVSIINSPYNSYSTYSTSTNIAIQVGAFRKYSGAKIYLQRYNALSNNYNVTIKTSTKNHKPLYRVRIEGFNNKSEAKRFMNRYGIRNAFLVRR